MTNLERAMRLRLWLHRAVAAERNLDTACSRELWRMVDRAVNQLSQEELNAYCVFVGWGLPWGGRRVNG